VIFPEVSHILACNRVKELLETGASVIVTSCPGCLIQLKEGESLTNTQLLEKLPELGIISVLGTGTDNIDLPAATERGIAVTNTPGVHSTSVAELNFALILACARKVLKLDRTVKEGGWKMEPDPDIQRTIWPTMSRLRGQTLGLIGLGRIPRTLVPKAKGFGVRIIAYDPYVDPSVFESLGVERVEFDQLLSESDIISLHSGLTSETRHMLGLEQFKKMKPSAYLVNTARGGLIDQEALYTALTDGYLAGAALDVTDPEPISPDDPLLKLDNVIITGHSAHSSIPAFIALLNRPGEEIARVFKGEWPVGLLNPQAKEKYRQKWG